MRDLCLDEGILQSYCDGELEPIASEQVRSHIATCSPCAEAARQVESEIEIATAAFAAEMTLSVPTDRLRRLLVEAIDELNAPPLREASSGSRISAWFGSITSGFALSPQRAVGFASLAIFLVLAAVVGGIVMRQNGSETNMTAVNDIQRESADLVFGDRVIEPVVPISTSAIRPASERRRIRPRSSGSTRENQLETAHRMLPGEKNYLQAISLLTEAIEVNGETSLKPTLLADYKRNLEVVNHAITATQVTARSNPKSPDAAEMLFAVYQSKLDLLSAVAEQSRPMIAQR